MYADLAGSHYNVYVDEAEHHNLPAEAISCPFYKGGNDSGGMFYLERDNSLESSEIRHGDEGVRAVLSGRDYLGWSQLRGQGFYVIRVDSLFSLDLAVVNNPDDFK